MAKFVPQAELPLVDQVRVRHEKLQALQQSVDTLLAMKQTITEKTISRLKEIGITVPDA